MQFNNGGYKKASELGSGCGFQTSDEVAHLGYSITNMRIESMPFENGRSVMRSQDKPFQGESGTEIEVNSPW